MRPQVSHLNASGQGVSLRVSQILSVEAARQARGGGNQQRPGRASSAGREHADGLDRGSSNFKALAEHLGVF